MERPYAPPFATEFEFTLPRGFIDEHNVRHRTGVMRLATGADEILPKRDPRVQANPAYLTIIILSRVITKLGSLPHVDTQLIEGLFAADLEYLRRLYEEVNSAEEPDGLPQAGPFSAEPLQTNGSGGFPVLGEA